MDGGQWKMRPAAVDRQVNKTVLNVSLADVTRNDRWVRG